jgi:hypothetical protein
VEGFGGGVGGEICWRYLLEVFGGVNGEGVGGEIWWRGMVDVLVEALVVYQAGASLRPATQPMRATSTERRTRTSLGTAETLSTTKRSSVSASSAIDRVKTTTTTVRPESMRKALARLFG